PSGLSSLRSLRAAVVARPRSSVESGERGTDAIAPRAGHPPISPTPGTNERVTRSFSAPIRVFRAGDPLHGALRAIARAGDPPRFLNKVLNLSGLPARLSSRGANLSGSPAAF